jgi:ParB family chromosome partitioning protein
VAERVVHDGLSVRATERVCGRDRPPKKVKTTPAPYPEIVEGLQERLGTKVRIAETRKGRGRILVDYFSEDDLNRIAELIRGR